MKLLQGLGSVDANRDVTLKDLNAESCASRRDKYSNL